LATRPTNHRFSTAHAAVIAVTSIWLAIVRLVGWRRASEGLEIEEALAEGRRAHLFGTAHPHPTSAK
jgi:hypothetical protein